MMTPPVGKSGPGMTCMRSSTGTCGLSRKQYDGCTDLAEVMGRHLRRHPDSDTVGAVDQEVRDLRGEDGRFLQGFVVVGDERHCLLIEVLQERLGDTG